MKSLTLFSIGLLMASCTTSTSFYQVVKMETPGKLNQNSIVFEDENCRITYNLWADNGYSGFGFYNKTTDDITIDLTKSFFVQNDLAHPYFQNRTLTQSTNSGVIVSTNPFFNIAKTSATTGSSTAYVENPVVTVPSGTWVVVNEYPVSNTRYMDCDLPKYPSTKSVKTLTFDKTTTPLTFYNLITYEVNGKSSRVVNEFYASEITNKPSSQMMVKKEPPCNKKSTGIVTMVLKPETPDKYYIKYLEGQ